MAICRSAIPSSPSTSSCRSQQHNEGSAGTQNSVDEHAHRLSQPHLGRVIRLCGRSGTRGRSAARLIGKQAALDAVHQHRAKPTGHDLPQTEGLRKDAAEHASQLAEIEGDQHQRQQQIASPP